MGRCKRTHRYWRKNMAELKMYAVAHINFMNNELHIEFIEAESEFYAMTQCKFFHECSEEEFEDFGEDEEQLKQFAFDMDGMVAAKLC